MSLVSECSTTNTLINKKIRIRKEYGRSGAEIKVKYLKKCFRIVLTQLNIILFTMVVISSYQ